MITLNSNAESQTASNQQEMPEIFFFLTLLASWILLPRLCYNQKVTADQEYGVESRGSSQLFPCSMWISTFLSDGCGSF